ncbi:TolB family protein [Legionella fallonii]|uniref:TolB-like protein n=1 Tax=Legionella fallonii LLAP-10 TaxID=1212491 RepID=A0A098G4J2_9GAMM|nr:PD40 domain-containing protein [Legionella fallonii]CEG56909.1 TolB-like protein [Legionella fallonii LLAP-10]
MKVCLFLLALMHCVFVQAKPLIAFERSGAIYTANMDGSKARKITVGYVPEISPDGKYIAYNVVSKGDRYLAIIELVSGRVTQLNNILSKNNFNPVWSPDNKKLLFNTFIDNNWHLALINSDGSDYRLIKNTANEFSPAWAADGKSFFSHDLYSISWMDLEGKLIKKWNLESIIPHSGMSSASRIHASADGKVLIMDVDMDENIYRKNWDGPPTALWTFDIDSEKATRITSKGLFAWSPFWINSKEFIFLEQNAKEKKPMLYRGFLTKPLGTLLLNDVQTPSISRD